VDRRTFWGGLLLLAVALVTLAPVLYVLVASTNEAGPGAPYSFSLVGWTEMFGNAKTWASILTSFLLSIRTPLGLTIAFLIAWLLIRVDVPGRRFIEISLWFGFFLPSVPMTMGWILLLDSNYGLINVLLKDWFGLTYSVFSIYSAAGIIWIHLSLTTIPIMVILLAPAFRQLDAALEEAATMSGAGTLMTLRRVTVPLIGPAIITAFVAGLIKALETFEVEQLLGTPANIYVYATRIYDLINWEPPQYPQAMALSALFLGILFIMAFFYQRYLTRAGNRPTVTERGVHLEAMTRPWWAWLTSILLFAYLAVSLLLPLTVLILGSFTKLFGFFFIHDPWTTRHWLSVLGDSRFSGALTKSILLGVVVGCVGVGIYALIAWVLERTKIRGRGIIGVLVWLPWAIPGMVLGVTLLSLMINVPFANVIYGTIVPVMLALIIKEMPIGVQMLKTSLGQLSPQLEEAAVMAGGTFNMIFRRITLPLIAPMLVSVFLLTFAGTIRDISTIVLLASPGTRTISLLMFDYATAGRFESAAVIGVIIAIISLVITTIAFRIGVRMGIRD
jgi:iron(III) transport system permease protein